MFGECHGHIFMNGVNYKEAVARHKNGVDKEEVQNRLAAYRDAGITFFREGGDYLGVASYAAGIAGEYGIDYRSPVFAIHKKGHYGSIVGLEYETLPEFAALVKKAAKAGADFIKIMFSGLLDFNTYGGITGSGLPGTEMKELVHICHEEGFAVMVHVNRAETIRDAILSGVDSIEHGNFCDDDALQALASSKTIWVPTILTVKNLLGDGRFPEHVVEKIWEGQQKNLHRAFELGVKLALGSDAGAYRVLHGQGLMDEYQVFQKVLEEQWPH